MDIENYREQPPGLPLVAIFDVYLPEAKLTFRNLKVLRTKSGGLYLGIPSFKQDGFPKPTYIPYFQFSKERHDDFTKKVMEAVKPFVR